MINKKKNSKVGSSDRSFGLVFSVFFAIIGFVPFFYGEKPNTILLFLAIITLLISFIKASLLAPLNKYWTRFGLFLHNVISPIILGFIYFIVLMPIGLLMRLLNKRPLQLNFEQEVESYWIVREPKGPTSESIKNQY